MPLSIRNREAEKLARELASETGETLTQAIVQSLRDRLERLRGSRAAPDTLWEIMQISRRCALLADRDTRSAGEILGYDASGAPF